MDAPVLRPFNAEVVGQRGAQARPQCRERPALMAQDDRAILVDARFGQP